jgi:hypothetical protein
MFEKIDLFAYWPVLVPGAVLLLVAPWCLSFFRSLKAEVRRLGERSSAADEVAGKLRQLAGELEQLRCRLNEWEGGRNTASAWLPEAAAVNLNRRGQILRLHRRGKSVSEIASALHVSQGEIELLVKVHDISQNPSQPRVSLATSGSQL